MALKMLTLAVTACVRLMVSLDSVRVLEFEHRRRNRNVPSSGTGLVQRSLWSEIRHDCTSGCETNSPSIGNIVIYRRQQGWLCLERSLWD